MLRVGNLILPGLEMTEVPLRKNLLVVICH